jgi:aspartyl-tRNA(Asn)/glutamyl-tRNA(Gln) amidotransferase subunit C
MALTLEDVKRVAHLARLAIDEAEARAVLSQINDVFKLIGEMQAVDTRGVVQRLREDKVTERDQHTLFQEGAPQVENSLYLVPKVIE